MKCAWMMFILMFIVAPVMIGAAEEEAAEASSFDHYYFVLLKRPEKAPDYPKEKLMELQKGHLEHMGNLAKKGLIKVAGPFENGPDGVLRGVVIYSGDLNMEEVRAYVDADPSIKAGRLEGEVLKWWVPADIMSFKKIE